MVIKIPFISVIIPLYNEMENVSFLLQKLYKNLAFTSYELILVDDGSTDKTASEIQRLKNDKTKLIQLSKNFGQSAAIKAGIDNSQNEIIVILDGDLQNAPEDIDKMIYYLLDKKIDFVQGHRINRHDNWKKKIPSSIANWFIRIFFNFPIHDIGCALKVFHRNSINEIHFFNGFHRYLSLLVHVKGLQIGEIEVTHHPRIHGKSKYGLSRLREVIYHLWLIKLGKMERLSRIEYN